MTASYIVLDSARSGTSIMAGLLGIHGIKMDAELSAADFFSPKGYFESISVQEKLSHVKDLVAFMTGCLNLLQPGGVLELTGAYDLSVEAWQDPRSIRSFNERSFIYFTDWFWQLGWDEYRFEQENINLQPNPDGVKLQREGLPDEEIINQPGTVSSIIVRLRNIALSNTDKETLRKSISGTIL